MAAATTTDVGALLREWRERRRLTQLEVALDTGVSARHLSFVETGRSKPGREMLLQVADRLEIPYRERNQGALTVATGAGDFRITSPFPPVPGSDREGTTLESSG